MLPPNTTHLYQALDKLFTLWHEAYLGAVTAWKADRPATSVSRNGFLDCFEKVWPTWCTAEAITNAFKRVGWCEAGVDRSRFPDDAPCFKVSASFIDEVC